MQDIRIVTNFRSLTWKEYLDYVKTQDFLKVFSVSEDLYYSYYEIINEAIELLNNTFYIKEIEIDILDFAFSDYLEIVQCLQNTDYYLDILCILHKIAYKDREEYKRKKEKEVIGKDIDLFFSVCTKVIETEKDIHDFSKQFFVAEKQEEKNAGIEKFTKKWGYYAIIDNLAKNDITKQKEILSMKTIDVLAKIKYDIEKNYYTDKLRKEYEATYRSTASNRR